MEPAVEMLDITKHFESTRVRANDAVSFSVHKGEVHALVGENGAGKTTLMNILYGLIKPDAGTIRVNGQPTTINHPDDAIAHGIGMVHQHFKLVPSFTVAENILLGAEPTAALGFLRKADEIERVRALAASFGLPIDPTAKVGALPVGLQQRVEILKALQRQAQILILDEPTAVLTPQEAKELFTVVRQLAASGRSVIFITHKLLEVIDVADRVSVMRKGKMIGSRSIGETTIREMANMMVGREVLLHPYKAPVTAGQPVLQVENLVVAGAGGFPAVMDVSFEVRAGQIVGIAGVTGNGQTELIEAIAGMRHAELGKITLMGKDITHRPVSERRKVGLAHIPEDRIAVGLNLQTSLGENLVVTRYRNPIFNRLGMLRRGAMKDLSKSIIERFSIRAARPGGSIAMLSGGNMQKVVLGRELGGEPSLIIANQPTRGLDVGSIEFVHKTLLEARERGAGILLVSVELDEILALSDCILVLFSSRINGRLEAADTTEEKLGILMAGGTLEEVPA